MVKWVRGFVWGGWRVRVWIWVVPIKKKKKELFFYVGILESQRLFKHSEWSANFWTCSEQVIQQKSSGHPWLLCNSTSDSEITTAKPFYKVYQHFLFDAGMILQFLSHYSHTSTLQSVFLFLFILFLFFEN